jgi:hypothetical protein
MRPPVCSFRNHGETANESLWLRCWNIFSRTVYCIGGTNFWTRIWCAKAWKNSSFYSCSCKSWPSSSYLIIYLVTCPLWWISGSSDNYQRSEISPSLFMTSKHTRRRAILSWSFRCWVTHSWSWTLLDKLPIVQPLKNFPAFYGTRRFITAFTRALHWSLSWAR